MTIKQLDRLLEKTVADALGVELPARRGRRYPRADAAMPPRATAQPTARTREPEPA
jgi:hypothetical protein